MPLKGNIAINDYYRLDEMRNRVYVEIPLSRTTLTPTPTTIYNVSSGRILHITDVIYNQISDTNVTGEWRITDNGDVKLTMLAEPVAFGQTSKGRNDSFSLRTPLRFDTNVQLVEITGDIDVTLTLLGYEE